MMAQTHFHNLHSVRGVHSVPSKKRQGVTLLEFIGVLVVSIIVISTAIALLGHLDNRRRLSQAVEGYQLLAHKIDKIDLRNIYPDPTDRTKKLFTDAGTKELIGSANFVPPGFSYEMVGTDRVFKDPFGNSIALQSVDKTLSAATLASPAQWRHLELAITNVKQDICIQLATELSWANNAQLAAILVEHGTGPTITTFTPATGTLKLDPVPATTFPIQASAANTACGTSGNTLRWQFVKGPV